MWQLWMDRLSCIEDPRQFFQTLSDDLCQHYASKAVFIWMITPHQDQLTLMRLDAVASLDFDVSYPLRDEPLCMKVFKSYRASFESAPLVCSNEIILEGLQCSETLLVPWVAQGQLFSIVSVHRSDQPFNHEISAQLQSLLISLSAVGFKKISAFNFNQAQSNDSPLSSITCKGLPCGPGLTLGTGFTVMPAADLDDVPIKPLKDYDAEFELLSQAVQAVKQDISSLSGVLSKNLTQDQADIFSAYTHMVDRHGLMRDISECMKQKNLCAQSALKVVVLDTVQRLSTLSDPYLRARSIDIQDIGRRILTYLQSNQAAERTYPESMILIGEEISLMDIASIPEGHLVGICSFEGSRYSHVSILARAVGLPMVIGLSEIGLDTAEGVDIFLDGCSGEVILNVGVDEFDVLNTRILDYQHLKQQMAALRQMPAQTSDHYAISLWVNLGLGADVEQALSAATDGVGLFRTELPFMSYDYFPSEFMQQSMYRQILRALSPKPVIIRTLDVGGDKWLPYFQIKENNPYLGWRGLRFCLDHPEVLRTQLRAMILASEGLDNLHIMVPMVGHVHQIQAVRHHLDRVMQECLNEGIEVKPPPLGMMLEVPAAVMQIDSLSQWVDFFSVGSNDLIQYLLAVDRNNHRVADLFEAFHPAVLKFLQKTVDDVHAAGKHVSICGEFAADPLGMILLVAMGFDTLSMNATSLDVSKWILRKFTLATCQKLLNRALLCDDAHAVLALLSRAFEKAGIAHLVHSEAIDL